MAALAFLIFVGCALAVWWMLVFAIPGAFRERTRHRLWDLRDGLVDEIRTGVYVEAAEATRLVNATRTLEEHLDDVSPIRLLLLRRLSQRVKVEPLLDLDALDAADRARLEGHLRELERLLSRQARFYTLTGLLTCWLPFQVRESDLTYLLAYAAARP
jgi:hypothetical protein